MRSLLLCIGVLLIAGPAHAAIAYVQDASGSTGSSTSFTITMAALTGGNGIVCHVKAGNESNTLTPSATGVTFTSTIGPTDSSVATIRTQQWSGVVNSSGATVVTITASGTQSMGGWCVEFSGLATSSVVDQSGSGETAVAGLAHDITGTVTTTQANEVLVGGCGPGGTSGTWTVGASYTAIRTASSASIPSGQYRIVSATGGYSTPMTSANSINSVCLIGTYKEAVTFPTVAATATSTDTVSDTDHVVSLPASIASGDLLIITLWGSVLGLPGTNDITCTGWTLLENQISGGSAAHMGMLYKIATGSEGASVTCTSVTAETSSHVAYRITNWHGTSPPEKSACATGSAGTGGTPDPDALTVSWGAANTLWIAIAGVDGDGNISAWPTNYSGSNIESVLSTAGDPAMGTRDLNAPNADPGTFTFTSGGTRQWIACTIAVRPASAAPPPSYPQVAASCTSTDVVSDTNHAVCIASGATLNDLLIVCHFGSAADATPNSAATGWTLTKDLITTGSAGHIACFSKISNGTESGTVTITTDLAELSAGIGLRITAWHGTTMPEASTGVNTAADVNPDPDSLTASWGSADNLWIAVAAVDDTTRTITAYPSSYVNNLSGTHSGEGDLGLATLGVTTATENPGSFTHSSTAANQGAFTMVVRPGTSGGSASPRRPRIMGGGVL